MISAYYTAFQLAPKAFNAIRMIMVFDIFTFVVVRYTMFIVFRQTFVAILTVCYDRTAFWYKRIDCTLQYPFAGFWNDLRINSAI